MIRVPALTRFIFVVIFYCSSGGVLHAQLARNFTYPLYVSAVELDTDRVTYSRHKITVQIDSTWENGKLTEWSRADYAPNGNVIRRCVYPQSDTNKQEIVEFKYNAGNVCIFSRNITLVRGDTTYMMDKRSIQFDTVRGRYEFETRTYFVQAARPDTTMSDFEWDYVDTKCKTSWSRFYINRTMNYVEQRPGSDTVRLTVYEFRDNDTLSKHVFMGGNNMYDVDTLYIYHSKELKSQVVFVNNRSTVSKAWENGKLIEHFVYVDSVADFRVWKSTTYNLLKNDSVPEIVITMSDTLNVVRKGGVNVFEDYTPDTVEYRPLPPPPAPEPTYESLFPYRKVVPVGNGLTRLEYYNFYTGRTKPLFIIIMDERGIVHTYYLDNMVLKRVVH